MSAIVKIEDPEGLINTLQSQIKLLENQIEREREFRTQDIAEGIAGALERLRLHSVIPLHVGDQDLAKLRAEFAANPILSQVSNQIWLLEAAPVAAEVKATMKEAANYGMNRWR